MIGLVFLVLLRFLVGCVVWASVFLVTFAFVMGGVVVYIRSFQCSGAGLLETGISTGSNVITTAAVVLADAVSGAETLSEAMTGNGADYRGGQRYTRSALRGFGRVFKGVLGGQGGEGRRFGLVSMRKRPSRRL